jgi:hypothetical protein
MESLPQYGRRYEKFEFLASKTVQWGGFHPAPLNFSFLEIPVGMGFRPYLFMHRWVRPL